MLACVYVCVGLVGYMQGAAGLHGHLSGETQGSVINWRRGQDSQPSRPCGDLVNS